MDYNEIFSRILEVHWRGIGLGGGRGQIKLLCLSCTVLVNVFRDGDHSEIVKK